MIKQQVPQVDQFFRGQMAANQETLPVGAGAKNGLYACLTQVVASPLHRFDLNFFDLAPGQRLPKAPLPPKVAFQADQQASRQPTNSKGLPLRRSSQPQASKVSPATISSKCSHGKGSLPLGISTLRL